MADTSVAGPPYSEQGTFSEEVLWTDSVLEDLRVSDKYIVWRARTGGTSSSYRIDVYELETDELSWGVLEDTDDVFVYPVGLHGGKLMYTLRPKAGGEGSDQIEVRLIDLDTGEERHLMYHLDPASVPAFWPRNCLSDRWAIWWERPDPDSEYSLHALDLLTNERRVVSILTGSPLGGRRDSASVSGDSVVWSEPIGNGREWDVFMTDLSSGLKTQLTFGQRVNSVGIFGRRVAYVNDEGYYFVGNWNPRPRMYLMDLASGVSELVGRPGYGGPWQYPRLSESVVAGAAGGPTLYNPYAGYGLSCVEAGVQTVIRSHSYGPLHETGVTGRKVVWVEDEGGSPRVKSVRIAHLDPRTGVEPREDRIEPPYDGTSCTPYSLVLSEKGPFGSFAHSNTTASRSLGQLALVAQAHGGVSGRVNHESRTHARNGLLVEYTPRITGELRIEAQFRVTSVEVVRAGPTSDEIMRTIAEALSAFMGVSETFSLEALEYDYSPEYPTPEIFKARLPSESRVDSSAYLKVLPEWGSVDSLTAMRTYRNDFSVKARDFETIRVTGVVPAIAGEKLTIETGFSSTVSASGNAESQSCYIGTLEHVTFSW